MLENSAAIKSNNHEQTGVKMVQLLFLIVFDVLYKVGRLISMNVLFFIV